MRIETVIEITLLKEFPWMMMHLPSYFDCICYTYITLGQKKFPGIIFPLNVDFLLEIWKVNYWRSQRVIEYLETQYEKSLKTEEGELIF